jgi:hypothetical protein
MRTRWLTTVALLSVVVPASGHAATCTVTDARVIVRSYDLDGPVPVGGLGLPTTIAEATGGFSLDLSGFPDTSFTIVGVESEVDFPPTAVSGTIDSGGNVAIPGVLVNLVTHFTPDPTPINPTITLSTGIATQTVTGADYATEGTPLDFTNGNLVLEGQAAIVDAPGTPGPITAGFRLACTLAPVPNAASLPKALTLAATRGQGKLGKTGATPPAGDTLMLGARLTPGAHPVDPTQADVFVRVRDAAGTDVVLARVKAGDLVRKGKKLLVVDTDGSKLRLVKGRLTTGGASAAVSGRLVLATAGKALKLTLLAHGVDLASATAGAGSVTVAIGDQSASDAVTLRKTAKRVTIR